jgi:hypothetical protein
MNASGSADDEPMSLEPLAACDQKKRTARKRANRRSEDRYDGRDELVAPVPSEEKSFRVLLLSRETGIDPDRARELVDTIERDGAALVDAARRMKSTPND